jgi:hypothetical protein
VNCGMRSPCFWQGNKIRHDTPLATWYEPRHRGRVALSSLAARSAAQCPSFGSRRRPGPPRSCRRAPFWRRRQLARCWQARVAGRSATPEESQRRALIRMGVARNRLSAASSCAHSGAGTAVGWTARCQDPGGCVCCSPPAVGRIVRRGHRAPATTHQSVTAGHGHHSQAHPTGRPGTPLPREMKDCRTRGGSVALADRRPGQSALTSMTG